MEAYGSLSMSYGQRLVSRVPGTREGMEHTGKSVGIFFAGT
jgi:hypothetical protein